MLPKAHQVDREFRVRYHLISQEIAILRWWKPLATHLCLFPSHICTMKGSRFIGVRSWLINCSLLDSPFYVMDYVRGRLYLDPSIPGVTVEQRYVQFRNRRDHSLPHYRKCLWKEAIQNLAHIHTLNVDKVGLGDYGRKGSLSCHSITVPNIQLFLQTATWSATSSGGRLLMKCQRLKRSRFVCSGELAF